MKARVKKDTCIGCGACTVIADKVFQIGEDGLAEVINPDEKELEKNGEKIQEITKDNQENVVDASESCPTGAIELTE